MKLFFMSFLNAKLLTIFYGLALYILFIVLLRSVHRKLLEARKKLITQVYNFQDAACIENILRDYIHQRSEMHFKMYSISFGACSIGYDNFLLQRSCSSSFSAFLESTATCSLLQTRVLICWGTLIAKCIFKTLPYLSTSQRHD